MAGGECPGGDLSTAGSAPLQHTSVAAFDHPSLTFVICRQGGEDGAPVDVIGVVFGGEDEDDEQADAGRRYTIIMLNSFLLLLARSVVNF